MGTKKNPNRPPDAGFTLGIDLGGTKILAVALDRDGESIARAKKPTPVDGGATAVLDTVADVAEKVSSKVGGRPASVGIGVPGPVDPATGIVAKAVNLSGFEQPVSVRDELRARLGVDVHVENDVNVATLGEQRLGAARGYDNVLGLFAGTGVGGGLVLDGKLRRGPHGLAGEIGHVVIRVPDGDEPPRTVEDLAGRASMTQAARESNRPTMLFDQADGGRIKSRAWAEAYEAGDQVVTELVERAAQSLTAAVIAAANLVDIEFVVLGGGMADRLGDSFRAWIHDLVTEWSFVNIDIPVVAPALGDESGARGAAMLGEQ